MVVGVVMAAMTMQQAQKHHCLSAVQQLPPSVGPAGACNMLHTQGKGKLPESPQGKEKLPDSPQGKENSLNHLRGRENSLIHLLDSLVLSLSLTSRDGGENSLTLCSVISSCCLKSVGARQYYSISALGVGDAIQATAIAAS